MTGSVPDRGRDVRLTTHDVTTEVDRVVRRGRRGVGGWWWTALLGVPLVLGGASALVTRGWVETDLSKRSAEALASAGVSAGDISFSGRDGRVSLPGGDAAAVTDAVAAVPGVRVVTVEGGGVAAGGGASASATDTASAAPSPSPSAEPSAAPSAAPGAGADAGYSLAMAPDGKSVTITATVPDEATKAAILAAVRQANPGITVDDKITVAAGAPAVLADGFSAVAAQLGSLPGVTVSGDAAKITLTGEVASEAVKTAAGEAAARLNAGIPVDNQLTVAASSVSAECATVNTEVAAALKATPVRFAVNAATILPASLTQLNGIAAKLKDCLGADGGASGVSVAGHTDSDGGDAANLALSQRRADAVKAALVKAGLPANAITAKGFGEKQPVADNASATGKAANRRVEITLT